jgi:hypothetical protein
MAGMSVRSTNSVTRSCGSFRAAAADLAKQRQNTNATHSCGPFRAAAADLAEQRYSADVSAPRAKRGSSPCARRCPCGRQEGGNEVPKQRRAKTGRHPDAPSLLDTVRLGDSAQSLIEGSERHGAESAVLSCGDPAS